METKLVVCLVLSAWVPKWSHGHKNSGNFRLVVKPETWEKALSSCRNLKGTFLPDYGRDEITKHLLPLMQKYDMVWLYAKEVSVKYSGERSTVYKYLEMTYRPTKSSLEYYLCTKGDSNSALPSGRYTWWNVREFCRKKGGHIYSISSPKQLKFAMPYFKENETFWIDQYNGSTLPYMVSDEERMNEMCVGIVKMSETTFTYRTANCTEEFKYFCDVSKDLTNKYAPTIRRLPIKIPIYMDTNGTVDSFMPHEISTSDEDAADATNIGMIVGLTCAGVILIIVGVIVMVMVKKKKSQLRYQKRWARYRSERERRKGGSIRSENIQHLDCDGNGTMNSQDSIKTSVILGLENGKYVHLRESAKSAKESSPRESNPYEVQCENKSHNIDQPGYYLMDVKTPGPRYINKKAAIEVQPCYEVFNPDPVQLKKQLNSLGDKNVGGVQVKLKSDLNKSTEVKKTPMRPIKRKQVKQLDDLDQYEQPVNINKPPELPVKKFKGPVYLKKMKDKTQKPSNEEPKVPTKEADLVAKKTEPYFSKQQSDLDQREGVGGELHPPGAFKDCSVPKTQPLQPVLDDLALYESYGQDLPLVDTKTPTSLNDLGQYENSGLPKVATQGSDTPARATLEDLDQYENFESLSTSNK